jgi:hypothetical protein
MRPGHERRVDPLDFTVHRLDDGAARTGKLRERECDEMAGPPVIQTVGDQLRVAIHLLSVDGVNSADPIVIVNFPVGFDRLSRLVSLGFDLVEYVPVGSV